MFNYKKLLLILLVLSITSVSFADTIEIQDKSGTYHLDFWMSNRVVDAFDTVGEFSITINGLSTYAFCVQLGPSAKNGEATLGNPADYIINNNQAGLQAAWLMDTYSTGLGFDFRTIEPEIPSSHTVTLYDDNSDFTKFFTNLDFTKEIADTALQIAIWETIYDYDNNNNTFYSQNFFHNLTSNGTLHTDWPESPDYSDDGKRFMAWALSEIYLAELQKVMNDGSLDGDFSGKYKFYVAEFEGDEEKQNLLVAKPIPEPATMILFGLGLLGISAMGRKRS